MELSQRVEAALKESKVSGGDRPIAWDGVTRGGEDLANQVIIFYGLRFSQVPLS